MNNTTDPLLDDLQTLWDEQDRRIHHLLATHPGARPRGLSLRHRMPWRRHVMAAYSLLILLNIAAGLFCLFCLFSDPYLPLRLTGYLLVATNAAIVLYSLHRLLFLHRHPPALTHSHIHPLTHLHIGATRAPTSVHTFTHSQLAAASAAALVVLLFVSCSPVGDGHVMTKAGRADRAAALVSVDNILQHI